MPSHRDQAQARIDALINFPHSASFLNDLEELVGDTQNGGDGTIDENAWYVLRDLRDSARKFQNAVQNARLVFRPEGGG